MENLSIMEILASLIGAIGGWELIRHLLHWRYSKKVVAADATKATAEATVAEFEVLKETVVFLQEQLQQKEVRFVSQTERLRKLQDDYFQTVKDKNKIELELQKYRCVVPKCSSRQPQNGY